jgi:hypothetical protein
MLPLTQEDVGMEQTKSVSVTALAYHGADNCLAVALSNGNIQCFRHMDEVRCVAHQFSCCAPAHAFERLAI